MRINSIYLTNYRQFKDLQINFKNKKENDLHIFIGTNGAGKSNILNAINWCLYFEEPHLHIQSSALPLLNLNIIKESEVGDLKSVKVEINAETDDGMEITYIREGHYRITENGGDHPFLVDSKFEVAITPITGDTEFLEGEDAEASVKRFVPNGIREYFFFDGERLDKYFDDSTGRKVKDSVFEISQVQLLETIEGRLNKLYEDLTREVTKNSPDLKKLNNEYEILDTRYRDIINEIEDCKKQITTSQIVIKECEEYLRGLPNVDDLEKKRENFKVNIDSKENSLKEKLIEEQDSLREYAKLTYLYPSMKKVIDIIEDMKTKNELPPNLDKRVLEKTLHDDHCSICNRNLESESINYISELIKKISFSSESSTTLIQMEPILKNYLERLKQHKSNLSSIKKVIKEYKNDLEQLNQELDDIDNKLGGYKDKDEIKNKHEERKLNEEILNENRKEEGRLEERSDELLKEKKKKKEELDKATDKNELQANTNKKRLFCERSSEAVKSIKNIIMEDNRLKIEKETERIFFSLIWKKDTFKNVIINDNYSLSLKHRDDYECLGSCSAAEKALLALSFTLSLHKVSGFDSPLVIDTPISRVSDTNRVNFAKVLADVSKNKQIILLFTPSEYSEEISETFDMVFSTKNILDPNLEDVTTIKGV